MDYGYYGTSHERRKIYCCAVMDTFSRKIVRWSIDNAQDSALVVNALDMAIKNLQLPACGIVHADRGFELTSWAFINKIRSSGLMPSFGPIGDCYDCQAVFVEAVLDSEVVAVTA
jgi:putative transposase